MATSPERPIVRFEDVSKSFDHTVVLDKFNLEIFSGDKVAIVGPSGSGKSTLLRVLMTLEPIDSGRVEIAGEPLWAVEPDGRTVSADRVGLRRIRQRVGMVFQHFNLFPHMTVLRNVTEAPVHVLGLRKDEAAGRARHLLELVGLADKFGAYPSQLSGGQKQRVAIARALAMQPEIMLFDEVTSALDPELVGEVLGVMRKLAAETEVTMVIVTHEMRFARDIANRIVFIERGRIVEQGPPESIFKNPKHERTRDFLSSVLDH